MRVRAAQSTKENNASPSWQVGDTFTTGDGRDLRITEIVPVELIEVSNERPAFALWDVEPALAAAGGSAARAGRRE